MFQQRVSHFYFSLSPTNYVACPDSFKYSKASSVSVHRKHNWDHVFKFKGLKWLSIAYQVNIKLLSLSLKTFQDAVPIDDSIFSLPVVIHAFV